MHAYLESEEVQHLTDVKVMTEQHVAGNLGEREESEGEEVVRGVRGRR